MIGGGTMDCARTAGVLANSAFLSRNGTTVSAIAHANLSDRRESARGGEHGEMTMQDMATRLCGSPPTCLAIDPGRGSTASVNYVACHDGFTTADLTMYKSKHNEANGGNNHDGTNDNHSVNFGHEGPSSNPIIVR